VVLTLAYRPTGSLVTAIIDSDISNIRQGRIDIHGTTISLHGKVKAALSKKQAIQNRIHASHRSLPIRKSLVVVEGEQRLIDDTLGNHRIVGLNPAAKLTSMGAGYSRRYGRGVTASWR
jgi:OOP family OmpA-OmpF porin